MERITTPEIQQFETSHIAKVRELAPECMVLLKNDGTLPLKKTGKIALFGGGARRTIKGGTGSGDVNVRHYVNVEEGLENAGFEVVTKDWLDAYDAAVEKEADKYFKELRKQADAVGVNPVLFAMGKTAPVPEYDFPLDADADTAVYVLARISGEGSDRLTGEGDISLTKEEVRDILALNEKYEHFVLVLNTGGMVDLSPVESVPAILLMGQLGTPTGDVLADVLTGKSYPSGKLTMTWAPLNAYSSTEGFGGIDDTVYQEGIYVGYRHFDTAKKDVIYPFGFGIGYTTFEIENPSIETKDGIVTVTATVKNTGDFKGKEIVQVYVSAPEGKLDKPYQVLAAYAKTGELLPGESETVQACFALKDLASFDEEQDAWILEAGTYTVRVGNCSRNTAVAGMFTQAETIITEKAYKASSDAAELRTQKSGSFTWDDVKSGKCTIPEFADTLTDEQLIYLCIGAYKDADDVMEIIGNAATTVAGAAGETTGRLKDAGVPALVMADGPAGIRISKDYTLVDGEAKGGLSLGGDVMKVYTDEELQAAVSAAMAGSNEETQKYYQYCVAIPIGTAIAQSWNDSLAESLGDLVGKEMDTFGVQIWLAPALNIHRSPLCGRNFEYYSEDPLISGKMAAAITKGVQKYPGHATTIKHFACNNQETNRYFSNSIVSTRAMREIYLKGFEICVKESQPHFIMTSYNLINGVHSCNRKDLITDILRNEWGFKGVVMTDWLVTGGMTINEGEKWPAASAAGNVKAGNDITMPGIPADKADMEDALANPEHPYALTRNDLLACAERVLEKILQLG
ncbi:MAG: glycoside hydrolase family 3 C-terminal domain-containing protein [Lachnospiraceae bacterium]|nr:glycoside hydrolase family 3 C-terminal domain-containing protein [Lachnospiraceae bacterium]